MKKSIQILILLFVFSPFVSMAQLPTCASNPATVIYIHQGATIYNYDVTLPVSATNPSTNTITMPPGAGGLAVSNNLNGVGPSPTFYTTVSGIYWYYDGTAWVNTGHSCGGTAAVNSGGGGNFLYNLIGGSGQVYKYDGTGPATLLITVPGFSGGGPYDLVGDCDGSFYILRTSTGPFLRKYDSMANLLTSWTATGSSSTAGGGFAIVNNTVYYHNGGGFHSAPFVPGPGNLAFSPVGQTIPGPSDMACCPVCGIVPPSPPPVANFSIPADTICSGTCIDFTDLSTGGATSWSWTFPGGTPINSAIQNPTSICFNTAGTYAIKQVVSNSGGSDSISMNLVVLNSPIGSITGDSVLCEGESANLNGAPMGVNYLWLNNNATTQNISVTPLITTNYTLVVYNGNCTDTVVKQVIVNPQPTATITGDLEICNGEATSLTANPGGGNYVWSHGPTAQTVSVNPSINTTYSVLVALGNCIDSTSAQVIVNPLPAVTATSTPTNCDENTGQAQAVGSLGTIPYSYSWSSGSNLAVSGGLGVGNYTVTLTDSKFCSASTTVDVVQHPNPAATITPYPVSQIAIGEQVELQAGGGVSFNWLNTLDLSCINCSNPTASPKNDYVYCVSVANEFGCTDTACTTILVDTSCANIFVPNAFTPNNDGLNDYIQFNNRCIDKLKFAIFNRWGQKVYEAHGTEVKWDGNYNGEKQLISTYFYVLEAELINGRTIRKRGDITLIR